ncbi:MAG: aminotransferase class I/II-fold pyridoxal phosphate-dependent enzyme, partial [Oligoflexia bacterium]|nr:aminotransferase class I/II-fold pyridoxal phosphate-dependent enzyme [Oligoflexia bacterium]
SDVISKLFNSYIPAAMNFPSPGYMGFIPSTGIYQAALGELIAKVANRHVGHGRPSPFLTQIESNVLRWFANIIGFPKTAQGIFTCGGSIANLTAVITARNSILTEDQSLSTATIYMSDQTHHSISKAALAAGIRSKNIKIIESDNGLKISIPLLKAAIEQDKKKRLTPFLIVGNAGTTNAGTVDPLEELSEISLSEKIWFHIDAAYGGFFALTKRGKEALKGIELADSVTMDPLKSLFLPLGVGSLLVRDGTFLHKSFDFNASYAPPLEYGDDSTFDYWDPAHMSLELSRSFRGLSVWLPIKIHGISAFRSALDEKLDLASDVNTFFASSKEEWDVLYHPELSITVISAKAEDKTLEELNSINMRIIDEVKQLNRIYLSGAYIKGKYTIRICVLNLRTHKKHILQLFEDLSEARKKVLTKY